MGSALDASGCFTHQPPDDSGNGRGDSNLAAIAATRLSSIITGFLRRYVDSAAFVPERSPIKEIFRWVVASFHHKAF